MPKAKKRKTSSTSRKSVSRKPIAIQRKVLKKDKSKIAWQIVLGIAAALLFLFIIAKFSASVTGNVPAVDAGDTPKGSIIAGALNDWNIPWLKDGIDLILGTSEDQVFISKIMFLILFFVAFWAVLGKANFLKNVDGKVNPFLRSFLTFALGVLFTRWIVDSAVVQSILVSYNAVGLTLTAIIPLIVVGYFLTIELTGENAHYIRVFGWLLFIGYLITQSVLAYRIHDGDLDTIYVYLGCIGISLIMIFVTPWLRKNFIYSMIGHTGEGYYILKIAEKDEQIRRLENLLSGATEQSKTAYNKQIAQLRKDITLLQAKAGLKS